MRHLKTSCNFRWFTYSWSDSEFSIPRTFQLFVFIDLGSEKPVHTNKHAGREGIVRAGSFSCLNLSFVQKKNQSSVIIFSHLCADSSIYFCIFVEKKELENHPICEEICYLSQLSLNFLVLWKYTKNALCRFQMTTNKFVIRSLRDII